MQKFFKDLLNTSSVYTLRLTKILVPFKNGHNSLRHYDYVGGTLQKQNR